MSIICVCVCVCVCVPVVVDSAIPWTVSCQALLSMEFSRQEYWSGLPFPSLGDFPNPGIKPVSLACPALAGRFFTTESPGKHIIYQLYLNLKDVYYCFNFKNVHFFFFVNVIFNFW